MKLGIAKIALGLGCLSLSACANSMTKIVTTPPGATVTVAGYGQCETPCTVELDGARRITVAKAGYKRRDLVVGPDAGNVKLDLELAAPTQGVEAGELPPLN
ncbi:MAG: PEGA domain-containing protein [Pseudomonadota bacterium]